MSLTAHMEYEPLRLTVLDFLFPWCRRPWKWMLAFPCVSHQAPGILIWSKAQEGSTQTCTQFLFHQNAASAMYTLRTLNEPEHLKRVRNVDLLNIASKAIKESSSILGTKLNDAMRTLYNIYLCSKSTVSIVQLKF